MANPFSGWNEPNPFSGWEDDEDEANPFAGWEADTSALDRWRAAPAPAPEPGLFSREGLADFGRGLLGATAELGQMVKFGVDELVQPGSRTIPAGTGLAQGEGLGAFAPEDPDELDAALTRAVAAGERGRHGLRGKALETFGTGPGGITAAMLAGSSVDIIDPTSVLPVGKAVKGGKKAVTTAAEVIDKADNAVLAGADLVKVQQRVAEAKRVVDEDAAALVRRARHVVRQNEMFPHLRLEDPSVPDEVLKAAKGEREAENINALAKIPDMTTPAARRHLAQKIESEGLGENVRRTSEFRMPPAVRDREVGTKITQPGGYKGKPTGLVANMSDWLKARADYFRGGARSGAEVRTFWDLFTRPTVSNRQVARRFANPEQQEFFREALPKLYEGREHRLAARAKQLSQVSQRLRRSVRSYAKANDMDVADVQGMLTERRRAGLLNTVPDDLREAAMEAGNFWDELSQEMIDSGMLTDDLKKKFEANKGSYYMNAYAVHDDPRWVEKVEDSAAWDDMYELMRQRHPEQTEEQIVGRMHRYLEQHGATSKRPAGSSEARKDLGYLRKRRLGDKPGDEIIQQFLGLDYKFADVFEESAARMIYDLEVDSWMREVRDAGLQAGVFTDDVVGRFNRNVLGNLEGAAPGAKPGAAASRTANPLNNVFSTPEVAELFDLMANEGMRSHGGWIVGLNSLAKANKLMTSTGSHLRNFASGAAWSAQQGLGLMPLKNLVKHGGKAALSVAENTNVAHLARQAGDRSPAFRKAMDSVSSGLKRIGLDPATVQDETVRMTELGVRQGGSFAGELGQYQSLIGQTLRRWEAGAAVADSPVGQAGGALNQLAKNMYAEADNFWKEQVWRGLRETYTDLGVGSDEVVDAAVRKVFGTADVDELAAGVVMDTMQTYDRTAPVARLASRSPVVGTYTSFPMEWLRNTVNNVHTAYREAAVASHLTGKMKARWIARSMSRVAGQASTLAAFSAYAAKKSSDLGWGKEKDEAWRRSVAPEWYKNSTVAPLEQSGSEITVRIADQIDPSAVGKNLLTSITATPGTWEDRLAAVAGELENQFLGLEIGAMALYELGRGVKVQGNLSDVVTGRGVTRQTEADGSRFARFARQVGPAIATDAEMLARERELFGLEPYVGSKKINPGHTGKKMGGMTREETYDLAKSMGFARRRTSGKLNELRAEFSGMARKARSPQELEAALESAEQRWDELQEEAINNIADWRTLGLPPSQIWEEYKGTVKQSLLRLWMRGETVTYEQYQPENYRFESVMRKQRRDAKRERSPGKKMEILQ